MAKQQKNSHISISTDKGRDCTVDCVERRVARGPRRPCRGGPQHPS